MYEPNTSLRKKKPASVKKTVLRLLLCFVVLDICIITLYPYVWSNFIDIWSKAPMARYMLSSLLIAMICGIPAAYALARMKFKGQTVSLFAIVPVIILFMCIEKYLVSGLASGGVKG